MAIRFQCPKCQSIRSVHERMSGHEIRCPHCDATIRIPEVSLEKDVGEVGETSQEPDFFDAVDTRVVSSIVESKQPVEQPSADDANQSNEEDSVIKVDFKRRELPKDDMDMTPMVDVTFLLLIFFMITASFTTEKALQQQVASDQPSSQATPEDENETIKILIDEFNAYTVIFPDGGESEATSKQELITILKLADLDGSSEDASNLVIEAHEDSIHAAVVGALDAGRQNKLTNFKVNVVESFD